MATEPYDRKAREARLRDIIAADKLNLHDVWLLGIFLAEGFKGMIKFTNTRVVLHVKHEPRAKKAKR